jgi:hypothetical protein
MSKTIKLYDRYDNYKGSTIVSLVDYPKLSKYRWNMNDRFYAYSYIDGKTWSMHRYICKYILKQEIEGRVIDHINNNVKDNRRDNLRCTSQHKNIMNRSKTKSDVSSKYIGTSWNIEKQKWKAYLTYKSKNIFIGYYDNEKNAAKARDIEAKEYFGKYAQLNFN